MRLALVALVAILLCSAGDANANVYAHGDSSSRIHRVVDGVIGPLMHRDAIPGMAVGIIVAGKAYVFDYGVATRSSRRPVTRGTLFELGSVSKTFTATLTAWAQIEGWLSLSDPTAKYLTALRGRPFGRVTLLELGTHTPGGLPLQIPSGITNDGRFVLWLRRWHATCAPGTCRTYSNPGIGALGLITAKAMRQNFRTLIERRLFPALGMRESFIDVPPNEMADYAWGYKSDGARVRASPGVLSDETYGVKTTASDMLRFLQIEMQELAPEQTLRRAITLTHVGYFRDGPMTQDLVWEQYSLPVTLRSLLEGNSYAMLYTPTPVKRLAPPMQPSENVWLNKTGTTNGFGAYVAFVPERRFGIVMLANKNYPIPDRVAAAYAIATALSANR